MMMTLKISRTLPLIILTLLTSCFSRAPTPNDIPEEVIEAFVQEFGSRYDLDYSPYSEQSDQSSEVLRIRFLSDSKWKIETVRLCMIDGVQSLLHRIHQAGKERNDPYLLNFSFYDLDFTLMFRTEDSIHVSHCYMLDGVIHYSIWDEDQQKLKRLTQEHYREALRTKGETP